VAKWFKEHMILCLVYTVLYLYMNPVYVLDFWVYFSSPVIPCNATKLLMWGSAKEWLPSRQYT